MTDLTPDQTQTELIERGGLVIASLVAHSWGGEAAIAVGDLITEIQRLDGVVERLGNEFERITEIRWGYDGDCGANNIAECAVAYIRDNRYPK